MAVELAILMPVILVVALAGYDLARFVALCATFDRISLDMVLAHGVAPAGSQTSMAAVGEVEEAIAEAMDDAQDAIVHVQAQDFAKTPEQARISMAPRLTRFTCVLEYRPWPFTFKVAGVLVGPPLLLRHERSLVVDRYKPGVVM